MSQFNSHNEFVTDIEFKKFRKKLEAVMEDTFDNLNGLLERKFQRIEERFDALEPKRDKPHQSSMDVDSDAENHSEPDHKPHGDSADPTTPIIALTASGPSPQKKLKGGHGRGEG